MSAAVPYFYANYSEYGSNFTQIKPTVTANAFLAAIIEA